MTTYNTLDSQVLFAAKHKTIHVPAKHLVLAHAAEEAWVGSRIRNAIQRQSVRILKLSEMHHKLKMPTRNMQLSKCNTSYLQKIIAIYVIFCGQVLLYVLTL